MKIKVMCLVAILFLLPVLAFAQDADIMVCKKINTNGTVNYLFPVLVFNQNKCLNGGTLVALQDALSGMTSNLEAEVMALKLQVAALEAKAEFKYDRIYYAQLTDNVPDVWDASDGTGTGTFVRVRKPGTPYGWDIVYDPLRIREVGGQHISTPWAVIHYYRCVPGSSLPGTGVLCP